jgi:predicted nucleotidyltransferase
MKKNKLVRRIEKVRKKNILRKKIQLQNKLKKAKEILLKEFSPKKIIVFGSFVKGNLHNFSDLDIIVEGLKDDYLKAGGRLIDVLGEDIDLKPYEALDEDFKKKVIKEGKVIYP